MTTNDTEHENPAAATLGALAAAVDEQLPAAWTRIGEYLSAYKESTGVLGRRKIDGDGNTAELRVEDLYVVLGALEAVLEAHAGPEVSLTELDAKLDQILQHLTPRPVAIEFDAKLSEEALAKFKTELAARLREGP